jgi:hypothetical protein
MDVRKRGKRNRSEIEREGGIVVMHAKADSGLYDCNDCCVLATKSEETKLKIPRQLI